MDSAVRRPSTVSMHTRRASTILSDVFRLNDDRLNEKQLRIPGQLRSLKDWLRGGRSWGKAEGWAAILDVVVVVVVVVMVDEAEDNLMMSERSLQSLRRSGQSTKRYVVMTSSSPEFGSR